MRKDEKERRRQRKQVEESEAICTELATSSDIMEKLARQQSDMDEVEKAYMTL